MASPGVVLSSCSQMVIYVMDGLLGSFINKEYVDQMGDQLCTREDESHNYLFFECGFSFQIWDCMIWKCGPQGSPREFKEALEWVSRWRKGKSSQSLVPKLSFSATVYHIWRERNCRIFQTRKMDGARIIQSIVSRACIVGWREAPATAENRISREDWALHRGFLAS